MAFFKKDCSVDIFSLTADPAIQNAVVDGIFRFSCQTTKKITVTAMTTTAAITVAALRGVIITGNKYGY